MQIREWREVGDADMRVEGNAEATRIGFGAIGTGCDVVRIGARVVRTSVETIRRYIEWLKER